MKISFLNEQKLPLLIEPGRHGERKRSFDTLVSESGSEQKFLRAKLLEHGALLFRGFDVETCADFHNFARSFSGKELLNYAGGVSPRIELGGGKIYTSTEYPPHLTLALHNELSYAENYPAHVYFCCLTAPEIGGETPIGDSRRILKSIEPEIVREFKAKQIRYERHLFGDAGSGFSWQDAFEIEDKQTVENYCRTTGIDFKWENDGSLRLSQTRPATIKHSETGEEVWFNQADGFHASNLDAETYRYFLSQMPEKDFRLNARFGDGSPLDAAKLERVRAVLRSESVIFRWQKGDVLILDNLLTAHGRMPFSGARKIVVAMT